MEEADPSYPPSAATWRFHLDRRRRVLLERRTKLEEATNDCLQLEAALTQLEAENLEATRKLREREILLRQARDALDQRRRRREETLAALKRDEEKLASESHFEERKLDNACTRLQNEKQDTATQHASIMDTLAEQQKHLEDSEQAALTRLYRLADVELELAARARRAERGRDSAQKALDDTIAQMEREIEHLEKLTTFS